MVGRQNDTRVRLSFFKSIARCPVNYVHTNKPSDADGFWLKLSISGYVYIFLAHLGTCRATPRTTCWMFEPPSLPMEQSYTNSVVVCNATANADAEAFMDGKTGEMGIVRTPSNHWLYRMMFSHGRTPSDAGISTRDLELRSWRKDAIPPQYLQSTSLAAQCSQ